MQHVEEGLCRQLENSSADGLTTTSIGCVVRLR